jgi:hypothetical protein
MTLRLIFFTVVDGEREEGMFFLWNMILKGSFGLSHCKNKFMITDTLNFFVLSFLRV